MPDNHDNNAIVTDLFPLLVEYVSIFINNDMFDAIK